MWSDRVLNLAPLALESDVLLHYEAQLTVKVKRINTGDRINWAPLFKASLVEQIH